MTGQLLNGQPPEPGSGDGSHDALLARSLVELTQLSVSATETTEVLTRVARTCQLAFPDPVAVSIACGEPGAPDLVATGSKLAQLVDGAQVMAGEGPCQAAWGDSSTVWSPDLREDARWPRLARHLRSSSVRSAAAMPLRVDDTVVGVLNVYCEGTPRQGRAMLRNAELLSTAVAAVLRGADVRAAQEAATQQLRAALTSRATIDQAKGMVMIRYRCGPDEAFEILVQLSSMGNVKLRDIAARMVEEASQGIEGPPDLRRSGGPDRG